MATKRVQATLTPNTAGFGVQSQPQGLPDASTTTTQNKQTAVMQETPRSIAPNTEVPNRSTDVVYIDDLQEHLMSSFM